MDPMTELFLTEPEEFVAVRDLLARRLKADDPAAAAAVKSLRRPALAVWLLNLVAHEEPDVVAAVRQVGADLRAAQEDALRTGQGAAMRELATARRRAVDDVVRAAVRVAAERGRDVTAAHRDAVAATAEAAIADDALAAEWASARLRGVHESSGFNFGADVAPPPERTLRAAKSAPPPPREKPATKAPATTGRSRRDSAASESTSAEDRQRAAGEKAERLRRDADAARAAVDAARAEWVEADKLAKAAKQRLRDAERSASRADLFAATAEQAAWEAGERARR